MTVSVAGLPTDVAAIIQDNTLQRKFHDALFPALLYRHDCSPERWDANIGQTMIETRVGLLPVRISALTPGSDPVPSSYATEQWRVTASQHADSIMTHMPTSYVSLASLFLRNTQQLGMNAGQTLNRLARNAMFLAYLSGECNALSAFAIGATQIAVSTINGFTDNLLNGQIQPVSAGNPVTVSFGGAEPDNTVIGFQAADPAQPAGPGVLTLGSALTVGIAAREVITSRNRARRQRAGGGASVDNITAANVLTLDDCIAAATRLRDMRVPPHEDGMYHAQITPTGEQQIFGDNHWQRLHQSLPDGTPYRDFVVNTQVGIRFYRNTEAPSASTVSATESTGAGSALGAPEIGADVVNENGIPIARMLVTGGSVAYEKYLDESKFITSGGVTGKIGSFNITNNGLMVMTDRIRFIIRAPLDALQQNYTQSWSWSGDFGVPSDQLTGDDARFKRAVVVEHAGSA